MKVKTSSEEKENSKMNKNQTKKHIHVPCAMLSTEELIDQTSALHTQTGPLHRHSPEAGPAVVCGAVHSRWVLKHWAPSRPRIRWFYQKATPAAGISLPSLRPSFYGTFFSPFKKNAQRQFCWSLREKHNTGGNPGQEEMEESHALHRNRRLWT